MKRKKKVQGETEVARHEKFKTMLESSTIHSIADLPSQWIFHSMSSPIPVLSTSMLAFKYKQGI